MAFNPLISVSQSAETPSNITVTDVSTGTTDPAVTHRRLYIQTANAVYLVPTGTTTDYISWALVNQFITVNVLTQDECVNIIVQWLDVSNTVLYQYENQYPLAEYNKQFLVYLVSAQGLTPGIVQDSNYSGNMAVFWVNIISGINQVTFGGDIAGGQSLFNQATAMRLNQSLYF